TNAKGDVWLRRRAPVGLLAGMTELPGSEWSVHGPPETLPPGLDWLPAGAISHVFTHFRLELDLFAARGVENPPFEKGWWCAREDIGKQALPSVFRKALQTALDAREKAAATRAGGSLT